ncbi:hypothetical protein ILUMI_27267 [Ignelater luminosus]|uniref:Peptidase S1 domain-containing protein n=1 Tax=Ignelater luminosus TaxID=2038154 RepID=A0A8K0FX03_IGNLU|nr:hypothetical protein ILUMI_27267 [Ignelater luminosus]
MFFSDYSVCGIVKEQARIWGGEIAEIGEFPWMAAIEYKNRHDNREVDIICGGSLINDEFVLSSAVCVLNVEFQATAVRLGEWDLTTDPDCEEFVANKLCADPVEKIPIKEAIAHPFFSRGTKHHDIALIRLERKIQFTEYIRPICVPPLDWPDLEVGTRSIVVGWGLTEDSIKSNNLMKVDVPIVSQDICNRVYTGPRSLPHKLRYLCVEGELGKGSCLGDSGGPLMRIYEDNETQSIKWYQDGIVSSGFGCARAGYPAIYTKVSAYSDWISNVIIEYETR